MNEIKLNLTAQMPCRPLKPPLLAKLSQRLPAPIIVICRAPMPMYARWKLYARYCRISSWTQGKELGTSPVPVITTLRNGVLSSMWPSMMRLADALLGCPGEQDQQKKSRISTHLVVRQKSLLKVDERGGVPSNLYWWACQ